MSRRRAEGGVRSFHELDAAAPVLAVRNVTVTYGGGLFARKASTGFTAVERVSIDVMPGRSLGIVGESGCGKTSLARSIVNLAPLSGGTISIGEAPSEAVSGVGKAKRIARSVQMVFQDPFSSLNPRQSVLDAVGEPLLVHRRCHRSDLREHVVRLLEQVGLSKAHTKYYPHQLSGGQRQRVGIARALAVEPTLLVCDEPTSALDVSIQAQVIEVFQHLQQERDLTYFFITHDLALLPQVTTEVAVMYLGRVVEAGPVREVLLTPRHPYTNSLVRAAPVLGRERSGRRDEVIVGDAESEHGNHGCPFRKRCWLHAQLDAAERTRCADEVPEQVSVVPGTRRGAACHYPERVPALDVALAEPVRFFADPSPPPTAL